MEPVVNGMSDLLSAVTTVITSFVTWMSSLTTALIGNAFVQIMFAISMILLVINLLVGFIKRRRGGKRKR